MSVRLTPQQQQIVIHDAGALLVVAGPGSGKTRVLTERMRRLLADPSQHFRILALTFTNKAANEMVERLDDVPDIRQRAFVGTLHSFCMEVLANRGKHVGVDGLPHIFEHFDDRKQVLSDAVRADPYLTQLLRESGDAKAQQKVLGSWLARISELKSSLVFPELVQDDDERHIYQAYDSGLRGSAALDYDDLLLLTYRLFQERPNIADLYCRQYRYVCIDEAQDLNEAQYRLLRALCGSQFKNVMLVGDPKQAIYVWNGAHPKYLDLFERDFSAKKIELMANFRSSRAVVEFAQKLNPAYVVEGQLPIEGVVEVLAAPDEAGEAVVVADLLSSLFESRHPDVEGPITPERCAILGRTRFVFGSVEDELKSRRWAYSKKLSAAALQSESEVVQQFELALRILANPLDRLHMGLLRRLWELPEIQHDSEDESRLFFGATTITFIFDLAQSSQSSLALVVAEALKEIQWTPTDFKLLKGLSRIEQYADTREDDARAIIRQDTREWRKHWDFYVRSESGGGHSVSSFLGQVALGTTQQPTEPGIALLTIHSAKGMEFDVVVLIGMNEGTFPDYRAKGAALEEEARSAFVAATRSKRLLFLTYPQTKRMPWGDVRPQKPSRYLLAAQQD
ncbi:MAG: ATP-dependent helicase [Acidobacteria bacterium]|nr:ATP-dependent helicase [Acidobacteriota bacterium]